MTRRQLAAAVRQLPVVGPVSRTLSQYPLSQYPGSRSRSASPVTFSFFDVFRHSTAPSTGSFWATQFWTRELLQLAHSERAIWHSTIALGALHQRYQTQHGGGSGAYDHETLTRLAMEHHGRAISHAQELKEPAKLLALSLSLVSITNLLGNWAESRLHIMAGQRLLRQCKGSCMESAGDILTRLDLQAMTFSDSSAPYPYREVTEEECALKNAEQPHEFTSYAQAGTELFSLFRRLMLLDEALAANNIAEEHFAPMMTSFFHDVVAWEFRMGHFEGERTITEPGFYSTRLYHMVLRLFLRATTLGPEMRWDNFLGYFERMLVCIEALIPDQPLLGSQRPVTVSLEPGLIIPLFIISQRCRHPILRRRAIDHLHRLNCQEGMWESNGAAAVAEKIDAIENEGSEYGYDHAYNSPRQELLLTPIPWETWATSEVQLIPMTSWSGFEPIPEENRIRETMVMVTREQRLVEISFIMCSGDQQGTYGETRTAKVHF